MDFSQALVGIKNGHQLARKGWNGKDQYLELQVPDEHSKMNLPYIYITTVHGKRVPWLASQTDLLSKDWFIVGGTADPAHKFFVVSNIVHDSRDGISEPIRPAITRTFATEREAYAFAKNIERIK